MSLHRKSVALGASFAMALSGAGLAGCGDEARDRAEQLQQDAEGALEEAGQGSQEELKRLEEQAREAQEDVEDALEEAQENTEDGSGTPSY